MTAARGKKLALWVALSAALGWFSPTSAWAQAADQADRLTAELDRLAEAEGADAVASEIGQARELLRLAGQAREAGQSSTAQTLLSLVPLQLQLIRALLTAARAEAEAAAAEERLEELRRESLVAREALEQVLERVLALSVANGVER